VRCEGFDQENYGLYSAGTLDRVEASAIDSHLAQDCETCVREVRRTIAFWNGFGVALSPDAGEPRNRLWTNAPVANRSGKPGKIIAWQHWGAIAAMLVAAIGVTFWFVVAHNAHERGRAEDEIAGLRQDVQRLSHERDQAIASGQQKTPIPLPQAPAVKPADAPNQQEFAHLQQVLAGTRKDYESAQQMLATARAQSMKLQADLNQRQTELEAARSGSAQLSAQISAAGAKQRSALQQVQLLEAQISQLQTEKARLANLVQTRERQSEQVLRTISYLSTPGTKFIELQGTQAAPGSRGYALVSRDNRLMFYQTGLPALASGRTYQIWLIRDKGEPVVSGGLFTADSQGTTQSEYNEANFTSGLRAVAVTEEPSGGSKLPTGHKLLIGTLRSS
jgi:hypothetical protein